MLMKVSKCFSLPLQRPGCLWQTPAGLSSKVEDPLIRDQLLQLESYDLYCGHVSKLSHGPGPFGARHCNQRQKMVPSLKSLVPGVNKSISGDFNCLDEGWGLGFLDFRQLNYSVNLFKKANRLRMKIRNVKRKHVLQKFPLYSISAG